MSWLSRLRNTLRPNRLDRDLEDEISHHFAMREQEGAGLSASRDDARRKLGNQLQIRERMRDTDVLHWLDTVLQDLRYAARQMRKSPGFTAVAVLSLALGIGANTGIFTVLNAVLLKDLPVRDPGELVTLSDPDSAGVAVGSNTGERNLLTYSEFEQLRDRLNVFDGMFASESNLPRVDARIGSGLREDLRARLVTGGFFEVLGVAPALGRFFGAEDDRQPGQAPYAVLSYEYWQNRFAGSPQVLGTIIRIGKATLTVIGVARPGFSGEAVGSRPDVWVPMMMEPLVKPGSNWLHEDLSKDPDKVMWLHVFGRLKPGITLAQAQAQADVVFKKIIESGYGTSLSAQTLKEFLDQHLKLRMAARGTSTVRGQMREPLLVLLCVVGLVLLISCANIANLLMARAAARGREMGVRVALGAHRRRLVRQMLTESLLLSALGCAAGIGFASIAVRVLLVTLNSNPSEKIGLDTGLDGRVLAFTAVLGLLTAILFGIAPAVRATRLDVNSSLKEGGRSGAVSAGRMSFAKGLVAVQVALSFLLLVGAGLFLRTLENLQRVELGYARDKILQLGISAAGAGYQEQRRVALFDEIAGRLSRIPGVRGVAYSENGLFLGIDSGDRISVEGFTPKSDRDQGSAFDVIGAGYFSNLGVPILLGREFSAEDVGAGRRVVVVNDAFAKKFFEGRNPLGRHMTAHFGDARWTFEVVGVAANVRDHRLRDDVPPRYYRTPTGASYVPGTIEFQIRAHGNAAALTSAARKVVQDLDDNIPILQAKVVAELVDNRMTRERGVAQLSATFGAIALVLACIGLYGVLSFGVARRRAEIGVRVALGASRSSVMRMIFRETFGMVAAGMIAGLSAAAAATRLIASYLFGVSPLDPATVIACVATLLAVAIIAGLLPAFRASQVNPVTALRSE